MASEHTKNSNPSNEEKHTKARPGRMSEEKRQHDSWTPRGEKKPSRRNEEELSKDEENDELEAEDEVEEGGDESGSDDGGDSGDSGSDSGGDGGDSGGD